MKNFYKALSALICVVSMSSCYAADQDHQVAATAGASVGLAGNALPSSTSGMSMLLADIKIDDPQANPFGVVMGSDALIVTGAGPEGEWFLPGQLWTVKKGLGQTSPTGMMRSQITQPPGSIKNYGNFRGAYYDYITRRTFVCSNSGVPTISSSVVVFEPLGDDFRWVGTSTLVGKGVSCRNITMHGSTLFAINERASAPDSIVLYGAMVDPQSGNIPAQLKPMLEYEDLGYDESVNYSKSKTLVSDIVPTRVEGAAVPGLLLSDAYKNCVYLVTPPGPGSVRATVKMLKFGEPLMAPMAIAQASPTTLLVSEAFRCVHRIRRFDFASDSLDQVVRRSDVAYSLSPVSSMIVGADIMGQYANPVVYAVESDLSYNEPQRFSVKEYALS